MYEGLVYVDTKSGYYARWSRILRMRTHTFMSDEPLTQYWVELIRTEPEAIRAPDAV